MRKQLFFYSMFLSISFVSAQTLESLPESGVLSNVPASNEAMLTPSNPCGVLPFIYEEDFNSGNEATPCWIEAEGGSEETTFANLTDTAWTKEVFLNGDSTAVPPSYSAMYHFDGSSDVAWFISPEVHLQNQEMPEDELYQLIFNYAIRPSASSGSAVMETGDEMKLLLSLDGGTSWQTIKTWNDQNTPTSNENHFYLYNLNEYAQQNVRFAFVAKEGSTNSDFNFYVDNFSINNYIIDGLGFDENQLEKLKVFPNPATDVVTISNDVAISNVELFDTNGRRLLHVAVDANSTAIDVSSFASGTYFLRVFSDGKVGVQQLLVR